MLSSAEILTGLQFPMSLLSGPINTSSDPAYTFTYQFAGNTTPTDPGLGLDSFTGWTALSAAEMAAVRAALDQIESFLNVTYIEVTGVTDPDVTIGKAALDASTAGLGGYAYSAWSDGTLADFDSFTLFDNAINIADEENTLILHELSHALTLKHPFESSTEGSVTHGPLPDEFDNLKYTLMSYTDNPDTSDDHDFLAVFDVFALQDRWGANMNHNTGNDTYTGPRGTGVDVIWDAGGDDRLDGSGYGGGVKLDLREGEFSRFGSYDDLAIALGVTIEHATGGAGGDMLTGNDVGNALLGGGGNDTLTGGGGDDTLTGGDGSDTAIFGVASDAITVTRTTGGYTLSSAEGHDLVSAVESFQFSDTTLTAAQIDEMATDDPGGDPVGTAGDDTLTGDDGDNMLDGLDGNDRLLGNGGNDTLNGGDGTDTLNGGDGDDVINGGATEADLRDTIFAGAGNDSVDGGYGNDLLYGQDGNDTIAGGFGADELQGQGGNDVITGSALSDLVFGGDGDDFVNGGFGHDRINGGSGADRFFHLGIFDHGSDWVQDYNAAEGDVLLFGDSSVTAADFQVNFAHTASPEGERAGDDNVQEAFVIYKPTEQIIWALVDGEGQDEINLRIGSDTFDLLA